MIAGGTSGTATRREILSFDPRDGRVSRIAMLPRALTHAAGASLGGRFYVVGGRGDGPVSERASIVAIDPAGGHVSQAGRLPVALSDLGAASFPDHVTLLGGRDGQGHVHDEIWTLRPSP